MAQKATAGCLSSVYPQTQIESMSFIPDTVAPKVTQLVVTGLRGNLSKKTFKNGDQLEFTLTNNESIYGLTLTDRIAFRIGTQTRYATFSASEDGLTHTFHYTLSNNDNGGISSAKLVFGGQVKDGQGNSLVSTIPLFNSNGLKADTTSPILSVSDLVAWDSVKGAVKKTPLKEGDRVIIFLKAKEALSNIENDIFQVNVDGVIKPVGFFTQFQKSGMYFYGFSYIISENDRGKIGQISIESIESHALDNAGNSVQLKLGSLSKIIKYDTVSPRLLHQTSGSITSKDSVFLYFDAQMQKGIGNIFIKAYSSDGTSIDVETISLSKIQIIGKQIKIPLTQSKLISGESYYLSIASEVFKSTSGTLFSGINTESGNPDYLINIQDVASTVNLQGTLVDWQLNAQELSNGQAIISGKISASLSSVSMGKIVLRDLSNPTLTSTLTNTVILKNKTWALSVPLQDEHLLDNRKYRIEVEITANNKTSISYSASVHVDITSPTIQSITFSGLSNQGKLKTTPLTVGDKLWITLNTSEFVYGFTSKDTLMIALQSGKVFATYVRSSGTQAFFSYTIKAGNNANTITLEAMTAKNVKDKAGNSLKLQLPLSTGAIPIDTTSSVFSAIKMQALDNAGSTKSVPLGINDKIDIALESGEALQGWHNTDRILILLGKEKVYASYVSYTSKQGKYDYHFQYTVQASNRDDDGITLGQTSFSRNVKDEAGNLIKSALPKIMLPTIIVQAIPSIIKISLNGLTERKGLKNAPLKQGEFIRFELTSSETLAAWSSTDKLSFTLNNQVKEAIYSNSTQNKHYFLYKVGIGDESNSGVSITGLSASAHNKFNQKLNTQLPNITGEITISASLPQVLEKSSHLSNGSDVITVTFDKAMKIGSGKVQIINPLNGAVIDSFLVNNKSKLRSSWDQKTWFFLHTSLEAGKVYQLSLGKNGLTDTAGNSFAGFGTQNTQQKFAFAVTDLSSAITWTNDVTQDAYLNKKEWESASTKIVGKLTSSYSINALSITSIVFKNVNTNEVISVTAVLPTISNNLWTLSLSKFPINFRDKFIDQGAYKIEVTIAGIFNDTPITVQNSSQETFIFDITPPSSPNLILEQDTGFDAADGITYASNIRVLNLEVSAYWEYQIDGGQWQSFTSGLLQAQGGLHIYSVRQTDIAGNVSRLSLAKVFFDDVVNIPSLALSIDSGLNTSDNITNNGKVIILGLEEGSVWLYKIDNRAWMTGMGTSFQLLQATHQYSIKQIDRAGNTSDVSTDYQYTLDNQVAIPTLKLAIDTGVNSSDNLTNLGTINVFGLEAEDWKYRINGGAWHTGTGNSFTATSGKNTYTVRQTDSTGNISEESESFVITMDTSASKLRVSLAIDTGENASDRVSSRGLVNVYDLEVGATWQYQIDSLGWIEGSGSSFNAISGRHTYTLQQIDLAGNVSNSVYEINVDQTVNQLSLALASDTGMSQSDNISNKDQIILLSLDPYATWQYQIDQSAWQVGEGSQLIAMSGQHIYTVRQKDQAGNLSQENNLVVTLDTVNPIIMTKTEWIEPTGNLVINFSEAIFAGGGTIEINDLGTKALFESIHIKDSRITFDKSRVIINANKDFVDGASYYITIAQGVFQDQAGNSQLAYTLPTDWIFSATNTVLVDVAWANSLADDGYLNHNEWQEEGLICKITNANTISNLKIDAIIFKSTDGGNNISLQKIPTLNNGILTIPHSSFPSINDGQYLIELSLSGSLNGDIINRKFSSAIFNIDQTAPTIPTLSLERETGKVGSGISALAEIKLKNIETKANWQYQIDAQDWRVGTGFGLFAVSGTHSYKVRQQDQAGNSSKESTAVIFTFDNQILVPTLVLESDTGNNASDGLTNFSHVRVLNLESNSTWQYQIDGTWQTGTSDSFTLRAGSHVYRVRQTDTANNISNDSSATTYSLDTSAPERISQTDFIQANENLRIIFSEEIQLNEGTITVKKSDGNLFESISIQSAQNISIVNDKTLVINPSQDLIAGEIYTLDFSANSIQDSAGNSIPAMNAGPIHIQKPIFLKNIASGTGGFAVNGEVSGDYYGDNIGDHSAWSLSSVGDFNRDGLNDFLIGAFSATANGKQTSGKTYLVYGKTNTSNEWLSEVKNGESGFVINGEESGDYSGYSVDGGDFNGDGLTDLFIGANASNSLAGSVYIVLGKKNAMSVSLSDTANQMGGFCIAGDIENGDGLLGNSIANAGDVNGDGLTDLIIGAPASGIDWGGSYVVFGRTGADAEILTADLRNGTGGFFIRNERNGQQLGFSTSSAGDINGDGLDDLIVGTYADPDNGFATGKIYITYGKTDTQLINTVDLEAGSGGFLISGEGNNDYAGYAVSKGGDINGDGFADILIGSPYRDSLRQNGKAYVIFGKEKNTTIQLSQFTSSQQNGFWVQDSLSMGSELGFSISSLGDVNGDGLDDAIIGGRYANTLSGIKSGKTYILFGKTGTTNIEVSQLEMGIGGFMIHGENANDESGYTVSSAGDVNGDGLNDILVGAIGANNNAGKTYVIFGNPVWNNNPLKHIGTTESDVLISSSVKITADMLIGGNGNDTITAGQGADVLYGGQGNDTFIFNQDYITQLNQGFNTSAGKLAKIMGGSGEDTIRLINGANLDLTTINNKRIMSIERINMETDTTNNALKISTQDIQNIAEMNWINSQSTRWSVAEGKNYELKINEYFHQILVQGNQGDKVELLGFLDKTMDGAIKIEGVSYAVYIDMNTSTAIFIQNGVTVI